MPDHETATAPAPDGALGTVVSVYWRPRNIFGEPAGDWTCALGETDMVAAQAFQALWAPDLDVVIWPGAHKPTRRELNGGPGA